MIELHTSEYSKIRHLLAHQEGEFKFVFAEGVIDLNQPGKIYVNHTDEPSAGILTSRGGKYVLFGETEDPSFNRSLLDFLANPANHANYYDLYFSSPHWLQVVKAPLEDNTVELSRSHYMLIDSAAGHGEHPVQSGEFLLTRMDEQLFERYIQEVDDTYRLLWNSAEAYLEKTFGYCYLNEAGFVSVCNTYNLGGGYIEPDIITHQDYRNRGLAFTLCEEFVRLSRQRKLIPYWDCDSGNIASNRLASKLGFAKVGKYRFYGGTRIRKSSRIIWPDMVIHQADIGIRYRYRQRMSMSRSKGAEGAPVLFRAFVSV